jgi:hypothetical protein
LCVGNVFLHKLRPESVIANEVLLLNGLIATTVAQLNAPNFKKATTTECNILLNVPNVSGKSIEKLRAIIRLQPLILSF